MPSPFQSGLLHQGPWYFPPSRDFIIGSQLLLEELLIVRIDQGIVLQSPGRRQTGWLDQLNFLPGGLVKDIFRIGHPIIGITDEIVDVHDARPVSARELTMAGEH